MRHRDRRWPVAVDLPDLLAPDHDVLVVYHLMFWPTGACPMCSMWLDGLNGVTAHVAQHVSLAVTAPAPLAQLRAWGRERGWHRLRLVSAAGTPLGRDLGFADDDGGQMPGVSVFTRAGDRVRLSWHGQPELRGRRGHRLPLTGVSLFDLPGRPPDGGRGTRPLTWASDRRQGQGARGRLAPSCLQIAAGKVSAREGWRARRADRGGRRALNACRRGCEAWRGGPRRRDLTAVGSRAMTVAVTSGVPDVAERRHVRLPVAARDRRGDEPYVARLRAAGAILGADECRKLPHRRSVKHVVRPQKQPWRLEDPGGSSGARPRSRPAVGYRAWTDILGSVPSRLRSRTRRVKPKADENPDGSVGHPAGQRQSSDRRAIAGDVAGVALALAVPRDRRRRR